MGEWDLALAAGLVLGWATVAGRFRGTALTAPIVFVGAGLLLGDEALGLFEADIGTDALTALTTAALVLVLFADAVRIDLRALRAEAGLPERLLGVGLPLTILAGTGLALLLFDVLDLWTAALLATILAPTDAALGQATVTDQRLPLRIRQGLNVESGLNDGLCVPLVAVFLALAEAEEGVTGVSAARKIVEEIGFGALGGLAAGVLGAVLLHQAHERGWCGAGARQLGVLAVPALAFGLAAPLGGSGFIAAFVAGAAFGRVSGDDAPEPLFTEELGTLLQFVTFLAFGAILLGPVLVEVDLRTVVYAVLSLTVVRMVPVALSLLGSGVRRPTVLFLGWFGPRGLASIVFGLDLVGESGLDATPVILQVIAVTVGLSVLLHGVSAAPWSRRYGDWYRRNPRPENLMESASVEDHRLRGSSLAPTG